MCRSAPKGRSARSYHHLCYSAGPRVLEWSAAAYERMQAIRDYRQANSLGPSAWDSPYVQAAHRAETEAWRAILTAAPPRRLNHTEWQAL